MNDGNKQAMIDRIRAILARTTANGCTEAEAEAAMLKAQALMDQYAIDQAEVDGERSPDYEYENAWEGSVKGGLPIEPKWLGPVIAEAFGVRVCFLMRRDRQGRALGPALRVFGDPVNVEMALWGYRFLDRTWAALWERYKADHETNRNSRPAFYAGLNAGMLCKLREGRSDETSRALVPINQRLNEAFAAEYGETSKVPARTGGDDSAYVTGAEEGAKIQMRRPIDAAERKVIG